MQGDPKVVRAAGEIAHEQRTNNECELVRTTRELRANNEPGISYSIGTGIGTYGGGSLLGNGR